MRRHYRSGSPSQTSCRSIFSWWEVDFSPPLPHSLTHTHMLSLTHFLKISNNAKAMTVKSQNPPESSQQQRTFQSFNPFICFCHDDDDDDAFTCLVV